MIQPIMQNKILLALATIAWLTGCANTPSTKKVEITVPPTYSQNIVIPKVEPIAISEMQWKILNKSEMKKFIDTHAASDFILYTVDENNMAVLVGNLQEMRRYIQSQQAKIEYLIGIIDARTPTTNKATNE